MLTLNYKGGQTVERFVAPIRVSEILSDEKYSVSVRDNIVRDVRERAVMLAILQEGRVRIRYGEEAQAGDFHLIPTPLTKGHPHPNASDPARRYLTDKTDTTFSTTVPFH